MTIIVSQSNHFHYKLQHLVFCDKIEENEFIDLWETNLEGRKIQKHISCRALSFLPLCKVHF